MELINAVYQCDEKEIESPEGRAIISEIFYKLIPMLNVFTPHVAEELWEMIGGMGFLYNQPWPEFDDSLTAKEEIEIVFQVNGKIRSKAQVPSAITKEEMEKMALADPKISGIVLGKQIMKKIVIPGKLVNIVIKG